MAFSKFPLAPDDEWAQKAAYGQPCCSHAATAMPGSSVHDLVERMTLFEAQSLEAARDVRRLYQAERARKAELDLVQAQMLAYANDLRKAFRSERAGRAELERAYVETVRALASAIDARDPYTGGHVDRVASYATALGGELELGEADLRAVEVGALLHDVGKIAVPDGVLRKAAPLDEAEWALMRQHPVVGANLVRGLAALQPALPAILHHHERYDGTGYPHGLSGPNIPPLARLVTIVDAFDAMLTDRPYRKGLAVDLATEHLEEGAGSQFDPEYTPVFVDMVRAGRLSVLKTGGTAA